VPLRNQAQWWSEPAWCPGSNPESDLGGSAKQTTDDQERGPREHGRAEEEPVVPHTATLVVPAVMFLTAI
jgi:hypothetical protein